jgi:ABC-type phosphate transport system auxiliary subunit
VDGLDPGRAWAWCQATAVVIAVTLLIGRTDDLAGEKMLAIARTAAAGS